jgi:predicted amidohydrolase
MQPLAAPESNVAERRARMKVAACSFVVREATSFEQFAGHARAVLDQAREADLVVLPELFTFELYPTLESRSGGPADVTALDRHTAGYVELFSGEAAARGQWILAGSHPTLSGGRCLNLAYLFAPDGSVHTHAKTHLLPAEHQRGFSEGDDLVAVKLEFATIGINVCYEAEIPECATSLAEQGALIVLCPSLTLSKHGYWRVRYCAHARCIENQLYFVHASCAAGPPGIFGGAYGASSVLGSSDDPWDAGGVGASTEPGREAVALAVVDLDALRDRRANGPAPTFRDRQRRRDRYAAWRSERQATNTPLGPDG